MLLLTQSDLRPLLADPAVLDGALSAIEAAVTSHARGEGGRVAWVDLAQSATTTTVYATATAEGATVRLFPGIGSQPPPSDGFVQVLLGPAGGLDALLAGEEINVLRTALPAAVGARHLAPRGARTLALLGSGHQARGHVRAITHAVPTIAEVRVFSPTQEHRESFVREIAATGLAARGTETAADAVTGADIVAATALTRPSVEAGWVREGALMISLTHSAPPDLLARSRVFVAAPAAEVLATARAGARGPGSHRSEFEVAQPLLLADVIAGTIPARERDQDTVVYELGAMYNWDLPLLRWACALARERGVGTEVALSRRG